MEESAIVALFKPYGKSTIAEFAYHSHYMPMEKRGKAFVNFACRSTWEKVKSLKFFACQVNICKVRRMRRIGVMHPGFQARSSICK